MQELLLTGTGAIVISIGIVSGLGSGLWLYRSIETLTTLALVALVASIPLWLVTGYAVYIMWYVLGFLIGYIPTSLFKIAINTLHMIHSTLFSLTYSTYKDYNKTK